MEDKNLCRGTDNKRNHTYLILDNVLQRFPFESLPFLNAAPFSRIPSLEYLCNAFKTLDSLDGIRINPNSGFYVLNPDGDLKSSQSEFEQSFSQRNTWKGVVERRPKEEEFRDALESNELFL